MARFAIAAALIASASPAAAATGPALADADPAIWVVNDEDTTIYLFGTFHALDGRSEWFNDEVKTAFERSDELVLETLVPLKGRAVTPGDVAQVAATPIKPGASFLASTRYALSAARSKGLAFDKGADSVLRAAAQRGGKKVSGIESFEYQLQMFSQIPTAQPSVTGPQSATQAQPAGAELFRNLGLVMHEMQASWNRGDSQIFEDMLQAMQANSPESYRMLFVQRNERWAAWIAQRLAQPGTLFVAVGAGHLAGADSVQNKLGRMRIRTARLN